MISLTDLGTATVEKIIPIGPAVVLTARKYEHSEPPMVGRINPCAERWGAGAPEALSGLQKCSAKSLPTLTVLSTPNRCSSENDPTWKRPGYHSLDLGRSLLLPCIPLPVSSGISNTSLPMHRECSTPAPTPACAFFFISDTILPSKICRSLLSAVSPVGPKV